MTTNTNSIASSILTRLFEDGLSVQDIRSVFDAGSAMVSMLDDAAPDTDAPFVEEIIVEEIVKIKDNSYCELRIQEFRSSHRSAETPHCPRLHLQETIKSFFPTFSHERAKVFADQFNVGYILAYGPQDKLKKLSDELSKGNMISCYVGDADITTIQAPSTKHFCYLNYVLADHYF